jgi:hypothetical protein
VTALIRGDGDGLGILLDGGLDDVQAASVVAEMNHLGAGRLKDPAKDVDRCVVTVKEGRCGDEADLVGQFHLVWR